MRLTYEHCSPAKAGVQFWPWDWTPAFAGEQPTTGFH